MAVDYVDLFCSDNDEFTMSAEEKAVYKERINRFKQDKKKYDLRYNLHTSNARNE